MFPCSKRMIQAYSRSVYAVVCAQKRDMSAAMHVPAEAPA